MEVKFKRVLYHSPANRSFTIYLPKEIAEPFYRQGCQEMEIWFDQAEQLIKMKPVSKEA